MCYDYSTHPNLQNLCDYENPLKLVNAQGFCYTDHQINVDSEQFQLTFEYQLSVDAFQEVINLSNVISVVTDQTWNCGPIGYKLEDDSYEPFIEVDSDGAVFVDPMSPNVYHETIEGLHEITFLAYYQEIDPDKIATFPLVNATLKLQLYHLLREEELEILAEIEGSFLRDAPIATTPILTSPYTAYFG